MIKFIYDWIINPFIKRFPDPLKYESVFESVFESEFDIENESVFAVDRDRDSETGKFNTVIGYYPSDGNDSVEWYIDCPIEKHNDYVKRLRRKLYSEQLTNATCNQPVNENTNNDLPIDRDPEADMLPIKNAPIGDPYLDENINDIYK